jgi:hypothetical protein
LRKFVDKEVALMSRKKTSGSWWSRLSHRDRRLVKTLGLLFLVLLLVNMGRITGGRAGNVTSKGNSLATYIPEGSTVIVLPFPPREGDFVTAVTKIPDEADDLTEADTQSKLSVKRYCKGRLVSTDSSESYSTYEYRGRVVAILHTERVFFWLNKGAQVAPYPVKPLAPIGVDLEYRRLEGTLVQAGKMQVLVMPHNVDKNFHLTVHREWTLTVPSSTRLKVCWKGRGTAVVRFGTAKAVFEPTDRTKGVFLNTATPATKVNFKSPGPEHVRFSVTPYREPVP